MTTTSEIYLKREEITDVQKTINDMLDRLTIEAKQQGEGNYTQVVIQLNHDDEDNHDWKMFIYFDLEDETYRYSFQDEDYNDTDFFFHNDREEIVNVINDEIDSVDGFEWICVDF